MPKILLGLAPDPVYVQLTTAEGESLIGGEFLVPPITAEMRRRWETRFNFCRKCGGIGIIPLGQDSAARCPVCRASSTAPTMDRPEIQQAIGSELCLGWRGVPTADGPEYEFTDEHRNELIQKFPEVFWSLLRTGKELAEGRATASGKA
jgi:hypothetical protein